MSSFTDRLVIEPANDQGTKWRLVEPFRYWITPESYMKQIPVGEHDPIVVNEGFITDFASIPRMFWTVLPPFGRYGKAAVIHDYLYKVNHFWSKDDADKIFLDAMKVLGVSSPVRYMIYYAVKYFGWHAWNKHRQQDKFRS